jgi:hypothetical protein
MVMSRRRGWVTTVLDVHTADLHGIEQARQQVRHLGSMIEVLMDVLEETGLADRSALELRVEQYLAAKAAAERVPAPQPGFATPSYATPSYATPSYATPTYATPSPPPTEPMQAVIVPASTPFHEQTPAYVYGAPPTNNAPMIPFTAAPAPPAPPPVIPRTISAQGRAPTPAPVVPAPAGSAFVACAVCKKRVLRASTNAIDGVGDVCDSCLGAT